MRVNHRLRHNPRLGATMILMVILVVILLGMVAFAVDVGRMYLARAQLQTAVDAGALAAGLQLRSHPTDIDAAVAKGLDFVQRNRVGSFVTLDPNAVTIVPGTWNPTARTFSAGGASPDSIQVSGTLENEPFFFGAILGRDTFSVPRAAIAQGGGSNMDIMMTLDLSGSMSSQGRIQALRDAAPVFIDVIKKVGDDDRIGVMGYGAVPGQYNPGAQGHSGVLYLSAPASRYPPNSTWCAVMEASLTDDFTYLRDHVLDHDTLSANKYNGWTPTGAAIRDSAHYLSTNGRSGVDKIIVLMSDGHANKPNGNGPGYALSMAEYAALLDIKIYAISLGNAADEDLMQQIADATGGEHFIASGSANDLPQKLKDAFTRAASAMKQSQLVQ